MPQIKLRPNSLIGEKPLWDWIIKFALQTPRRGSCGAGSRWAVSEGSCALTGWTNNKARPKTCLPSIDHDQSDV